MKYCMINTTCDNIDVANKIIEELFKNKLASCVQVTDINSSYVWNGKIENTNEKLLSIKTKRSLYNDIEKLILDNHNYELPQIVVFDIDGYDKYLDWIDKVTK